VHYTKLAHTTI